MIGSYGKITDWTTAGGGRCKWCFVSKAGEEYFLKHFLSPKFPVEGSPGSDKTKKQKRNECAAFEERHRMIASRLKEKCAAGGNLVLPNEFFREGTGYYKVSPKIVRDELSVDAVSRLSWNDKLLIMKTAVQSVRLLHVNNIIHGDLKPDNILLTKGDIGGKEYWTAKLIDFDDSYFSDSQPPGPAEIVGDAAFYSPELHGYVIGEEIEGESRLSEKSDIFALGLVFHLYSFGVFPKLSPLEEYESAGHAVGCGETLEVNGRSSGSELTNLISNMLAGNVSDRPTSSAVLRSLKEMDSESISRCFDSLGPDFERSPDTSGTSRLRGLKSKADSEPRIKKNVSRLKGSMMSKE